jgi:hypothetical protein
VNLKRLQFAGICLLAASAVVGMAQYSSDEALVGIWGVVQSLVLPFTR